MNNLKILIVDDDEKILFAFREVLQKDNQICLEATDGIEALKLIEKENPDLVFMDITMPNCDGLETLRNIKAKNFTIPVIIITGQGTMQTAISAMQLGAFQYLMKPLSVKTIREEIKKVEVSLKTPNMNSMEFRTDFTDRHQLVGNSPDMHEVYKLIGSVSTTPNHTSVLLFGETGTGKELVARAIHNNSQFAHEPFIAVNCTALPETLLESELFGHERGAFTGALDRKIGKFEQAGQGTIFLDEIGDLSPELQQKLLRVLQEREMERLGDTKLIPVEARFIAATNQNLTKLIKDGYFREDLYYRLNVVTIKLPPLHKRKDDIPLLANFFLKRYNLRLRKNISGISNKALSLLQSYTYPGNVRELENLIERAVMLTSGNLLLTDAIGEIHQEKSPVPFQIPLVSSDFAESRDYIQKVFEKQFVKEQLSRYEGNISAAAKASNMSRQNFHRLIEKHNIKVKD
jgi:DNA-binding NtrC family response regulator